MKSILLVVIARAWLVIAGGRSLYLYEKDSDPILEYKGDAKNDFTKSTKPRFVEFYSPHCPACAHFKPEYIEMAKQMQKDYSSSDIEFYAVSCDAQPEICSKLEIEDTPSMFAFPKGSTERIKVSRDETTEEYTIEQLARALDLPTGATVTASRRMDDTPSYGKGKNKDDASKEDGDDDDDKEEEKDGDGDDDDDDKEEDTKGDDDDDDNKEDQKDKVKEDPTEDDKKHDTKAENEPDAKRKDRDSNPSGATAEKDAKPVDNKAAAKGNDPKTESSKDDKKIPQEKPSKPDKDDTTKGKPQDDAAAKKEAKKSDNEKEVKVKDISKGVAETDEKAKPKAEEKKSDNKEKENKGKDISQAVVETDEKAKPKEQETTKTEEKKSDIKEKENKPSENKDNKAKGSDDKAADASTTDEGEKVIEEGATMLTTDGKKQNGSKHSEDSPKPDRREEESPDDNESATKEENAGEVENQDENNADTEEEPDDENESKDENNNESQGKEEDDGDDDDEDNNDGDKDDEGEDMDGRDGDDDDNDHDGDDDDDDDDDGGDDDDDDDDGGDDDDDDDDNSADLSNDSRSDRTVALPSLEGPALQRRHDAGHNKARNQEKALDRFKDNLKSKIDEYEEKRKGLGKFIRKDKRLDPKGKLKKRQDPEAMTEGMKAYTPGTPDFEKRREAMKKRLEKANKRRKNPSQVTESTPIVKDALPYKKDVRKPSVIKNAIAAVPLVGRGFRMTPEEELILDVSLSLVTSLETGVKFKPREGLTPKQTEALQNFLDLLNVALPPEWGIHKLINDLRRRFSYITKGEANFKLIMSEHPLPRQTWSSSCDQPEKGTSGFSCGFWKLLHVVTVGVADLQGGMSLLDSGLVGPQTKLFSPVDAADAIRDYINEFFSCQPCREHFVKTYDNCNNNRRCDRLTEDIESASIADWKELPLWLWEVHNEVSVRLMNERPQRSKRLGLRDEIAVIWPSLEGCFLCFHEDGTWDEAEVFKHLESTYWPDSELDPRSERLIQYDDTEQYKVGLLLWLVTFIALCFIYSLIKSTSPAILQQRLYLAKRLVRTGPGKKRSQ